MRPNLLKRSVVLFAVAALAACSPPSAPGEQMVVVTIAGDLGAGNRGAFDAEADRYFAWLGADFPAGRGFTRPDLATLPQVTVQAARADAAPPGAYEGPLLADVLNLTQPPEGAREILAFAIDGYSAAIPMETARDAGAILALRRDGEPLNIGGQGPAMIVFPDGANADPAWYVWGLVLIEIE